MPDVEFCPTCGADVIRGRVEGRERPVCPECGEVHYRNAKPSAGVFVVDEDSLLLIRRAVPPNAGSWSIPAGYLEVDEPPKPGAARELAEETGLSVSPDALSFVGTTLRQHPDGTHVLVLTYTVPRSETAGTLEAGSDASDAEFWHVDEILSESVSVVDGYRSLVERAVEV